MRLCNIVPTFATEISDAEVVLWKDTVLGIKDRVSEANEAAWRAMLLEVCGQLCESARAVLKDEMEERIEGLWTERLFVAEAVANSIVAGVEF